MAKLDNDDLKAIKDLMEVTIDEAIENKGLATNDHIGNLPTKDEFYGKEDGVFFVCDRHDVAMSEANLIQRERMIRKDVWQ